MLLSVTQISFSDKKNSSVKSVSNSNFFYLQIYRRIFLSVKETKNFPPKFEIQTNFSVDTSVGNSNFFYRQMYRRKNLSVKEA